MLVIFLLKFFPNSFGLSIIVCFSLLSITVYLYPIQTRSHYCQKEGIGGALLMYAYIGKRSLLVFSFFSQDRVNRPLHLGSKSLILFSL